MVWRGWDVEKLPGCICGEPDLISQQWTSYEGIHPHQIRTSEKRQEEH